MTMVRVQKFLRLLLQNPKIVKDCIFLLIFGHILTFVAAFVNILAPDWSGEKVNMFFCPGFDFKIARYWYFKFSGEMILNIITYYLLAKVAKQFSDTLFLICVIFFGYHLLDLLMFWWDSNTQFVVYIDILWTVIMLIGYASSPAGKEKLGRIRSLF